MIFDGFNFDPVTNLSLSFYLLFTTHISSYILGAPGRNGSPGAPGKPGTPGHPGNKGANGM